MPALSAALLASVNSVKFSGECFVLFGAAEDIAPPWKFYQGAARIKHGLDWCAVL